MNERTKENPSQAATCVCFKLVFSGGAIHTLIKCPRIRIERKGAGAEGERSGEQKEGCHLEWTYGGCFVASSLSDMYQMSSSFGRVAFKRVHEQRLQGQDELSYHVDVARHKVNKHILAVAAHTSAQSPPSARYRHTLGTLGHGFCQKNEFRRHYDGIV